MYKFYNKEFAQECARFRKAIGCSQNDVAEELNIKQESVSYFENGKNNSCDIALWYIKKGLNLYGKEN